MAIKPKNEIMENLSKIIGDNNSDDVLELLTDINDTLGNSTDAQRIAELETQLSEQDALWRKKYRDAFLNGVEDRLDEQEPKKPKRFEDLFTTE